MKTPARVLAAVDRSAGARSAAERAFRLAAASGARLDLMHVVSQGALDELRQLLGGGAGPVEAHLLAEARSALDRLAAELGEKRGVSAGAHLVQGTVLSAILERADAIDAGLLVLGARGEGEHRRLLLGTTAERLLRRTLRPMLVVRQPAHDDYRRILVPIDFSAWSAAALRFARALAPAAELVVMHAYEVPFEGKLRFAGVDEETIAFYVAKGQQDALAELQALTAANGADEARLVVAHGEAPQVILEQAEKLGCDLVVMGKHGRSAMEELLLGSATKHVLAESPTDVLVCGR